MAVAHFLCLFIRNIPVHQKCFLQRKNRRKMLNWIRPIAIYIKLWAFQSNSVGRWKYRSNKSEQFEMKSLNWEMWTLNLLPSYVRIKNFQFNDGQISLNQNNGEVSIQNDKMHEFSFNFFSAKKNKKELKNHTRNAWLSLTHCSAAWLFDNGFETSLCGMLNWIHPDSL